MRFRTQDARTSLMWMALSFLWVGTKTDALARHLSRHGRSQLPYDVIFLSFWVLMALVWSGVYFRARVELKDDCIRYRYLLGWHEIPFHVIAAARPWHFSSRETGARAVQLELSALPGIYPRGTKVLGLEKPGWFLQELQERAPAIVIESRVGSLSFGAA